MAHGTLPSGPPGLRFRKMHGLGNDFVVIDARGGGDLVTPALARRLGDRHRGVGFDQLAVIRDGAGGVAVDFWNADGSRSAACGNATRCVAALLMREEGTDAVSLRTGRGVLRAEAAPGGLVRVNMGQPVEDWRTIPLSHAVADIDALPLDGAPSAVGMGNPHCVFFVPDAEAVALGALGPRVEADRLFPERTNVEVVSVIDRHALRMRVWERGLGITLACGSGACAAAVAAARRGLTERRVTVALDGGPLQIDWRDDGVWMAGPVAEVFEGVLNAAWTEADP